MKEKKELLREKAKEKLFYKMDKYDKIEYMNENIFKYDDSNIPYNLRKQAMEELNYE